MTIALFCLAGFVLYPLLAGVTFRFLGSNDRLRILWWLGHGQCCSITREWHGPDTSEYAPPGCTCTGWESTHPYAMLPLAGKAWTFAALWPLVLALLVFVYSTYWLIVTPIVLLARVAASQAQLAAGDRKRIGDG